MMMKAETKICRPTPKNGIMDIAAYVPGESTVKGLSRVYKLSSNETPLGPSPAAIAAYRQAAGQLELYPDSQFTTLREAISDIHKLSLKNITCGNGSDEILGLLANIFLAPGDEGIMTEHGFSTYHIQMLAAGGTPVIVKEKDCRIDIDAILSAVSERTKIVFIANPGNPTGTYLKRSEIEALHAGLPPHVLLVLDCAYAEYVAEDDYSTGESLVAQFENVVMTRTFSKIYGLASLRVGWMYAPDYIIDAYNRTRSAFNVNAAAIAAASAAMRDQAFMKKTAAFNAQWRKWLTKELIGLGLKVTPSVTNFLLIHFPAEKDKSAALADDYLKANGYILRRVGGYGFPDALRLSIGPEEANRGFISVLKTFLQKK